MLTPVVGGIGGGVTARSLDRAALRVNTSITPKKSGNNASLRLGSTLGARVQEGAPSNTAEKQPGSNLDASVGVNDPAGPGNSVIVKPPEVKAISGMAATVAVVGALVLVVIIARAV